MLHLTASLLHSSESLLPIYTLDLFFFPAFFHVKKSREGSKEF